MKNKITRANKCDCNLIQTNWLKIICSTETENPSPQQLTLIQEHLSTCVQCRDEIGSYFLPELWESEPTPLDLQGSILGERVLESLGISAALENPCEVRLPVPSSRIKFLKNPTLFPRIQPLLINFATTALIILTLTCTGYFNLLPQLENGVKTLSYQVGTTFYQTQTNGVKELKTLWTGLEHTLKNPFHFKSN